MDTKLDKTMNDLQDMADFKEFGKPHKSGMYGEMPIVSIGRFNISQMSDADGEKKVWIQDGEDEGMSIDGNIIEKDFEKLFYKWF